MNREALRLARLAERAAARAGAFLLNVPRPTTAEWSAKGHHDFVTTVDRETEHRIRETLLRAEPDSRVMGEELTPDDPDIAGLVWVVDPLDGTANYLHDYPSWAVSIAAAIDGALVAGTVLHVAAHRRYTAWRGGGAWAGPRRLRVSEITDPALAMLGTGFPFKKPELLPRYNRMLERVLPHTSGVRRAGAAALDLADVAQGRFEGFWELVLAPWDMAAGLVLIEEAGGRASDLSGQPLGVRHSPVVAGNPAIWEWLLRTLEQDQA